MAEFPGSGGEPVIPAGTTVELGPDASIYGDMFRPATTPEPSDTPDTESPAGAEPDVPAVTSSEPVSSEADGAAPESVDAQSEEPDTEQPTITRRNAQAMVEKAIAERDAALAAQRQQEESQAAQQAAQQAYWEDLQQKAAQWNPPKGLEDTILAEATSQDWEALAKRGLYSERDALDHIEAIKGQRSKNASMLEYWRGQFLKDFGEAFNEATERTGVPWSDLINDATPKATLTKLLDAEKESVNREWQGKYDALKADYDRVRAASGAGSPGPESGGGAPRGGWNWERYQQAVTSGEADKWPAAKRDQVVAECMKAA